MVNIGDTVLARFYGAVPLASDAEGLLRARLQASGLNVLQIDTHELTPVLDTLTIGWGGWGNVYVSVVPFSSAYARAEDVASIVAGAAYAVGFHVDFSKVTGSVVAVADRPGVIGTTGQYEKGLIPQQTALGSLANSLGVSESTLMLGGVGAVALAIFLSVKR